MGFTNTVFLQLCIIYRSSFKNLSLTWAGFTFSDKEHAYFILSDQ